ncbi:AraC family transcriptional regulator [Kribbella sp. NPDC026611]|uniref:AraC family transcriptional regulator n=1 Tax=Kribbella sp. NPDC026611 TaxID=3154911 RepID=UPI0033E00270
MPVNAHGQLLNGVFLESYSYPPGPAGTTPSHSHDEYQLCVGDPPNRYRYRGGWHVVPPATLSVLMPGEVHLAVETADRTETSGYQVLYADARRVEDLAAELGPGRGGSPDFADVALSDRDIVACFRRLHHCFAHSSTQLRLDSEVLSLFFRLIARHTRHSVEDEPPVGPRGAVQLVRSYLEENFAANVSLEELAALSNLSPFHLARVFRQEVGMPPHAYQLQVRLTRAKRLLLQGMSVSAVATETGFFDLSHFTRHFKRHVGVSPGSYVAGAQERTLRPS